MGRQRAVPLYKIPRGDPWRYHVLSVLEAQNRSQQQNHTNVATFGASSLLFSYFLPFHSFPCSWSGPGPCGCIVPRETLLGSFCAVLPALYISFCHFWKFLLVLDRLWTQRPWKAMGRQRAVPYKIMKVDPWGYHVSVCFGGPEQIRTESHANVATFGASSLLFSYFLSFHSFPCSWRPRAGSGQRLSIKSRGVTPARTMFLSVFANVATFGASSLLFSYFLPFHSFPCSWSGPGHCGCVPREISWKFLCRSSCSLRSWKFLLVLECLWIQKPWKAIGR